MRMNRLLGGVTLSKRLDPVLEREFLLSLRTVGTFMFWAYVVFAALWGLLWILPAQAQSHVTLANSRFDFGLAEVYLVCTLAFEAWYRLFLGRVIRRNARFPRFFSFFIVGLESFQPTFFLLVWGLFLPPQQALSQSPLFFYFIIIGVNAMRLDPMVALFSGVVAFLGYDGLSYFLFLRANVPDPLKVVTADYASKGVYLFVCGAISAFVAYQMRLRLVHSVEATLAVQELARQKDEAERAAMEREVSAILQERERLAKDLHDSAGQKLGFLNIHAQALEELMAKKHYSEVAEGLKKISAVARDSQTDIRDFLQDTRATQILAKGFLETLRDLLANFEVESGIHVEAVGLEPLWESELPIHRKVQTVKIIAEALANIRKHAGIGLATLSFVETATTFQIEVADKGKGFQTVSRAQHFGLQIMKDRAVQAGGTLGIESSPGAGTRLVLEFPKPVSLDPLPRASRPSRILVVDDHELFREGLINLLQLGGFLVVGVASGGNEAIAQVKQTRPDLVLMDIQMADMDGLMATRVLKEQWPGLKVIVITASASAANLHQALKAGASGYVLKGVKAKDLFELIDGVAAGEVTLTAEIAGRIMKEFPASADGGAPQALYNLSARQLEVLQWAAAGLTYKEIGQKLFIAERTVKFHMAEIVEKLHVKDRIEATRLLSNPSAS